MNVTPATHPAEWDAFLRSQSFSPFLQSWTMGEVFRDIGQEPIRLEVRENGVIVGICLAIVVPARRGRHLMVQYGPVASSENVMKNMIDALHGAAREHRCSFLRISPFLPAESALTIDGAVQSPLHLLAEHLWYLPLTGLTEEQILMGMRKTTRNLIRRAEKEGVTIELSKDPITDLSHFIALHDETRKRHKFTPYTNSFFRSQVQQFAESGAVLLYLARFQGQVIASSIHMQFGGETSYHHGASSAAFSKIPASYLLQWQAIKDALHRGDHLYNFWGIAPVTRDPETDTYRPITKTHPFSGVTLFKTGFGGTLLNLQHCFDIPITRSYHLTRIFEIVRKWRRGF